MNTTPDGQVAVEAALERGGLERRWGRAFTRHGSPLPWQFGPLGRRRGTWRPRGRDRAAASTCRRPGRRRPRQREAVHAPRRRALDPLAADVEHRPVARALEAARASSQNGTRQPRCGHFCERAKQRALGVDHVQPTLGHVGGGAGRVVARRCPALTGPPPLDRRAGAATPTPSSRRATSRAVPPTFQPLRRKSRRRGRHGVHLLELDVPVGPRGDELPARARGRTCR